LKNWNPEISHQKFVNVVAKEFQNSYGGTSEVCSTTWPISSAALTLAKQIVDIDENLIKTEADIGNSVDELQVWDFIVSHQVETLILAKQSWDWSHGQTPEFTHDLRQQFSWGIVVSFPRDSIIT
jgi:hypothetical protein